MEKRKLFYPEKWEVVLTLLSICLVILPKCFTDDDKGFKLSLFIGTATCIITAILILYIQRVSRKVKLYNYYKPFADTYTRINIGQDNSTNDVNTDIKRKNVGLQIHLEYKEENTFGGTIEYWSDDVNGKAIASTLIEFTETNKMIGAGTYKYADGGDLSNHFGVLQVFVLKDLPNRVYVKYQHVFPRELDNNPDNNRGWEIWEKK